MLPAATSGAASSLYLVLRMRRGQALGPAGAAAAYCRQEESLKAGGSALSAASQTRRREGTW